ncbi:M23 family metallopeptidase [Pajaroellobacter abortibovis]|uniref:M23ase beta-sheet core domain-containing protein n=1 Tax=Pajaroellobacter abortibovis TaxID=1882918 RepID=A0A1L6MXQ1_9BACT|nr:M23 family metallopeptidase [Pajaroellobacter abortibovis]APS00262.1 hypothetical protein BCY86_05860 [Pajaroellobacter abortibovis]
MEFPEEFQEQAESLFLRRRFALLRAVSLFGFLMVALSLFFYVRQRKKSSLNAFLSESIVTAAPLPLPEINDKKVESIPPVWRLQQLAGPRIQIIKGTVKKKTLFASLRGVGVSKREAYRVLYPLSKVPSFQKHLKKSHDSFTVAKVHATGRVLGLEYEASPQRIWQVRERENGTLEARKLALRVEYLHTTKAVLVRTGLYESFKEAGFGQELSEKLQTALRGYLDLSMTQSRGFLRFVISEERIEGVFTGYRNVEAVEYLSPQGDKSVRIYRLGGADSNMEGDRRYSFYDAKGKQIIYTGWSAPLPTGRVSSSFSPRRKHPIHRVVIPHTGVDYAAPMGTPVRAAAAGVVRTIGKGGPCGNMVQIEHPRGITSAYCHLSAFAPRLREGQQVKAGEVIGNVGHTGSATGDHLHFAIKRGSTFINPLSLGFNRIRMLPPGRGAEFEKKRTEADALLDATPLPPAV